MLAWRSRLEPSGAGIALSAGGLAVVLAENASAAPAALVDGAVRAAVAFAAGKAAAGVVSAEAVGLADVEPARVQVTGVQAEAEPLAAACSLHQVGQLVERAPERAAGAGGVLQVQLAPLAFGQCAANRLSRAPDRVGRVPPLGRAGVQDHAARAERLAGSQRVHERGQRFRADLGVLAGAVQQVNGVDQHRVDRAVSHRAAEGLNVGLAVRGRSPHARGLVEDLDRATAALDAAFDRSRQPARGRDVRAN